MFQPDYESLNNTAVCVINVHKQVHLFTLRIVCPRWAALLAQAPMLPNQASKTTPRFQYLRKSMLYKAFL